MRTKVCGVICCGSTARSDKKKPATGIWREVAGKRQPAVIQTAIMQPGRYLVAAEVEPPNEHPQGANREKCSEPVET